MQSAQDCICDDVPEGLDRASVWCILPKRNMRTPPIIIGGELRKDPPQVLFVEHDQMIGTLAPDRPDQAFNMTVLPGRTERSGPVPNAHRLDAACEYAAEGPVVVADDICWRPLAIANPMDRVFGTDSRCDATKTGSGAFLMSCTCFRWFSAAAVDALYAYLLLFVWSWLLRRRLPTCLCLAPLMASATYAAFCGEHSVR